MPNVPYFGIHTTPHGISFLEQQKTPRAGSTRREPTATNALGMSLTSPFRVRPAGDIRHCPHDIRINEAAPASHHWEAFCEMVEDDPLLQALLPVPRTPNRLVFSYHWPNCAEVLALLSKMSAPLEPVVKTIYNITARQAAAQLEITNVQPLVLVDAMSMHIEKLEQMAAGAWGKPRNLIVIGREQMIPPPAFKVVETKLANRELSDLIELPWERIGGTVARKVMRGEWKI